MTVSNNVPKGTVIIMSERIDCNGGSSSDFLSMYISQTEHSGQLNGHTSEINFTPSPQKFKLSHTHSNMNGYSNESEINGNAFCNKDNIKDSVTFLNHEITAIGLPSLYEDKQDSYDVCRLVNSTYDLLQKYSRSARLREELENRLHRQESDINHLRETQRRLLKQLDQSQQETVQSQERERQLNNKNKTLSSKLKTEREEVKRLLSVVQHRDAQYKHELKKKEREQTKLKDRLHKMLSDRKGGKIGIEISTVLARQDGKRGKWVSGNKQEEELYRQVISSYEDKQKELLVENSGLRQCLNDIQKEVIAAFREPSSEESTKLNSSQEIKSREAAEDSDDEMSLGSAHEGLGDGHFEMPYEFLEGNTIKTIKDKCRQLRKHIKLIEQQCAGNKSPEKRSSPSKTDDRGKQNDTEKMKREVQRYKDIIAQQDQFIQESLGDGGSEGSHGNFLNESEILQEKENLDVQKRLFEEQKDHFQQERSTYTEATIRLHKDKKAFEDEKVSFLQNQFLQMTPFQTRLYQGHPVSTSAQRHKSKRFLPTTPAIHINQATPQHAQFMKTPDCQRRIPIATPTTRDLYRHLGLTEQDDLEDIEPKRPKSADIFGESSHTGRSLSTLSPSWANSGRRRCSSAVTKTSPSGEYAWKSRSDSVPNVADHVDNIKMMLFNQSNNTVPEDIEKH